MEERVGSAPSACLGAGSREGDESPPADEDDFYKLMDEHGIIGLGEEEEPVWEPKDQPSPDTLALEDLSHRLRELMDSEPLSQSPKEDSRPQSLHDLEKAGDSDSVEEDTFSEEEEDCGGAVQWWQAESQPERDGQLEGAVVEPDRDMGVRSDLPPPREQEESAISSRSVEGVGSRGGLCPVPSPSGGVRGGSDTPDSAVPPEQYPKAGQLNQRPMQSEADSWNWSGLVSPSNPTLGSGKAKPRQLPCELPCPAARHPPETSQTDPQLKACHSQRSGGSESHHTTIASTEPVGSPNLDGSRRGRLSHPLPDFSKIKPKVHFPKRDYRPPRSKGSSLCRTPGPAPPAALKSPADIVKEVLMSSSEGPHAAVYPSHPGAIVPPEFSSPQQAHALMHQLQENYNRLLTKYAEAENTIDRLRLEAKVNLYSDPPEPRHSVHLGTISMGSKEITLTFPQAQRAELGHTADPMRLSKLKSDGTDGAFSSSEASPPSQTLDHPARQLLTEVLTGQSDSFRKQVDCFEDFVKNGKLTPFQQMEGLWALARGLDALERGYLQARDEHRLLQQHGMEPEAFDPHRELEGWIFRLGMRLEELREQVGQTAPDESHLRSSCPPPSEPDPLSVQYHRESPPPLPKTPIFPMEGGAMSPLCEEAEPHSAALHPKLWMKHQQAECDFSKLSDHYQRSKELPGPPDLCQESEVRGIAVMHPPVLGADKACRGNGRVARQDSEQNIPSAQLKETGGVQSGLPPAHTSRSLESHFPRPLPHSHPRGLDRPGGMPTHGDKLQSRHGRAPPLDGIVSPETDSGFVGSESSRLTPVVHSCPQRMWRARLPHHVGEAGTNVQPTPVQPSLTSDSTRPSCQDHTGGYYHAPPSRGESRVAFPCPSKSDSPQHWDGSGITMTSGINESDIQSSPSVCEEEESRAVPTSQPTTEQPFGQMSPSPTASHHRGAPIRAQLTDKQEAIQSLRVEMNMLREGLEASLGRAPTGLPAWVAPPRPSIRFTRSPKVRGGGEQVKQKTEEEDVWEEESLGLAFQRRSSSTSCRRPDLSITPDSEHGERTSKPRSSRNNPASPAARGVRGRTRSDPMPCRGSGRLCHLTRSSSSDEPERRETQSSALPPSRSHPNGGAAHSPRCPLCSAPEQLHGLGEARGAGSSRKRHSGSTPRGKRPVRILHKAASMAAPLPPSHSSVPVVYCVPVCPSVLYCPSPVLGSGPTFLRSLYRPLGGAKADAENSSLKRPLQPGSSLSSDTDSLGQSLSRAIEAAASMQAASQHMARSLASGLRNQGALECLH